MFGALSHVNPNKLCVYKAYFESRSLIALLVLESNRLQIIASVCNVGSVALYFLSENTFIPGICITHINDLISLSNHASFPSNRPSLTREQHGGPIGFFVPPIPAPVQQVRGCTKAAGVQVPTILLSVPHLE